MKGKHLLVLLATIFVILVMVATSCSPTAQPTATGVKTTVTVTVTATPSSTAAAAKDKTYKVLNPEGDFVPVQTRALSPRLDTIKGKTIYVWQGESDPVIGPALYALVQKSYPDTTWKYVGVSGMGLSAIEADVKASAQAVIRLNGW